MKQSPLEQKISAIVEPAITELGFNLFLTRIVGEDGGRTVQIMAEDPATKRLGIDDCTKITRAVSALLDVEDPIAGAYRLEVSSPGIDRFLIRLSDYVDYKGFEAKIELDTPTEEGQKRFRGVIEGIKDEKVITLKTDTGPVDLPFHAITKSKLVMTDELIRALAPPRPPKEPKKRKNETTDELQNQGE